MTRIADRYELVSLLGEGSMGAVYLGRDLHTGQNVAIKVPKLELELARGSEMARFMREAEALRQLNHPNIVRLLDFITEDDRHYLVMDYIEGGSLRQRLRGRSPLPLAFVFKVALGIADALTRAHSLDIIHRDIKPANVLLDEADAPYLTDFGVARVISAESITQAGMVIGSPSYLSPEACRGKPQDARSDIWSFGVVAFEMLSGQRPFHGDTPVETMKLVVGKPLPDLQRLRPDAPAALVALVERMLNKDRDERIPSVRLVGAELEAIMAGNEQAIHSAMSKLAEDAPPLALEKAVPATASPTTSLPASFTRRQATQLDYTGQTIRGYELREKLGSGGYGMVYRAYQLVVDREVAVKVILPDFANDPDFIRRFETEARLVARLEHPHIVPLFDYWREPNGAYLVMRLLRSGSLRGLLHENGPLNNDTALQIVEQIAAALAFAHRHGVVHRDLKPANILLDDDGNAYLADFGIAKSSGRDTAEYSGTGAIAYMAPEQIHGQSPAPAADIYSLGVVLYELFAGRHPWGSEGFMVVVTQRLNGDPVPPVRRVRPDLPEALDLVIQKATALDPQARYTDAKFLAADLRMALMQARVLDTAQMLVSTDAREIVNPYKGLRPFEQADAEDFFGREALCARLIARLSESGPKARFLAVIGASGSGKSSLVKAGLLPALWRGQTDLPWATGAFYLDITPGPQPLHRIEAALLGIATAPPGELLDLLNSGDAGLLRAAERVLPSDGSELFLLLDQFEELFTQVEDEAKRTQVLRLLLTAVTAPGSRLRLVITLRADYYDRPLNYSDFGELLHSRMETVLPMTQEELQQAIVGPAERVGLQLEPGLEADIIADVNQQPGALPLLQYALTELYEQREDRTLTRAAYREIGGVAGALAKRAEDVFCELAPAEQETARQVFLRLVTLRDGADDTRRRAHFDELAQAGEKLSAVLDRFGKYRLLSFDHDPITRTPTIEVAHEALIRSWERLRGWLDNNRETIHLARRLSQAAREWGSSGQDDSFLARGNRLQQFETLLNTGSLALSQEENAYLQASIAECAREAAENVAQQARERALEQRSRYFLRALVAVMAVAAVVALGLMLAALNQQQIAQQNASTADEQRRIAQGQASEADRQRRAAEVNQNIAEASASEARSLALASSAQNTFNEGDTSLASSLIIAAYQQRQPPLPEVEQMLAQIIYTPGPRLRLVGHQEAAFSAAVSPDGRYILSGGADQQILLWNADDGTLQRRLISPDDTQLGYVRDVVFSPDGRYALSGSGDGTVRLWEVETGQQVRRFGPDSQTHTGAVLTVAFSPDGQNAASGGRDARIVLWDVATGTAINRFDQHTGAVLALAFSPDGRYLISGSGDAQVAGAPPDRTIRLWDVQETDEARQEVKRSPSADGPVYTVAFSPDGRYVASGTRSASGQGIIHLWDAAGAFATPEHTIRGHSSAVTSLAFSHDSRVLVSGSWDQTVRFWDTTTTDEISRFTLPGAGVQHVALSPDGQQVVIGIGQADNSRLLQDTVRAADVWVWDLANGVTMQRLNQTNRVWGVAVSQDGRYAAAGYGPFVPRGGAPAVGESGLALWDLLTGQPVMQLNQNAGTVYDVAFAANGTQLLMASEDGTASLWQVDFETKQASSGHVLDHDLPVLAVAFSPDERTAATGTAHGLITLWDVETGSPLRRLIGHRGDINAVAFSPDGRLLASGSADGTLRLWETSSGESLRVFAGHRGGVNEVAFSPDGAQLLSSSWDRTVRLWDVTNGGEVQRFEGHTASTWALAFTPDGQHILSGGADATIRLWRIETGNEVRRYSGHTSWVLSLAFAPGGSFFVSGAEDNTLRQWRYDATSDDIVAWAEANRYLHEFTCAERDRYRLLPDPACNDG